MGDPLSIDVLAAAIPPEGYSRFKIVLQYSADIFNLQQQTGFDEVIWPDEGCDLIGRGEETKDLGQYVLTCKRAGTQNSFFLGPLANIQFECKQQGTGTIELVAGTSSSKSSFLLQARQPWVRLGVLGCCGCRPGTLR